jgi:MAC/Perforin domain
MKKFIFALSVLCVASCTQELEEQTVDQTAVDNVFLDEPKRRAGDGLDDVLGQGYDVTKDYANANSAKSLVIDVAKFKLEKPDDFYLELPYSQNYSEKYGDDAKDYTEKVTKTVGVSAVFGLFGASLDFSNITTNKFESKYVFGSYDLRVTHKRLKMDYFVASEFENYLTPTFKANIPLITAANVNTFINRYGTHVMTDIYTGARLEALFRAQTTNTNRNEASKSSVKANFGVIFPSASISNDTDITDDRKNFDKKVFYRTRGGDPTKAMLGEITINNAPNGASLPASTLSITQWLASSNQQNSVLIEFGDSGLIPIYDLIADPVKKTLVRDAVNAYLNSRKVSLLTPPPPAPNVATFFQHPSSGGYTVSLPVGEYTQAQLLAKGIQNDDLSSMNVTQGYVVELYAHSFINPDSYLTKGAGYYGSFASFGYDNVVSAIKIYAAAPNVATVYQHGNYGGYAVNLPVGDYTMNQLRSRGIYNDDISSLKTNAGYKIILHQDDFFNGPSAEYWGLAPNFNLYGFNDRTTSLEVTLR